MLSLCILGFAFTSQAQLSQKSNDDKLANTDNIPDNNGKIDWSRFFVGGNLGGGISNGIIQADVSPHIGYYVTDKFSVGAGPSFLYFKRDSDSYRYLGGHAFARYDVLRGLFLQAEYDYLNFKYKNLIDVNNPSIFKDNFPALLAGGGLNIRTAGNGYFTGMILYNFLDNKSDTFGYPFEGIFGTSNPIIRIGGGFRL